MTSHSGLSKSSLRHILNFLYDGTIVSHTKKKEAGHLERGAAAPHKLANDRILKSLVSQVLLDEC